MTPWIEVCLLVPLAPLAGAIIAGLGGRTIGRQGAHSVAILGVAIATIASAFVFHHVVLTREPIEADLYTWTQVGTSKLTVGFLIDRLAAQSEELTLNQPGLVNGGKRAPANGACNRPARPAVATASAVSRG